MRARRRRPGRILTVTLSALGMLAALSTLSPIRAEVDYERDVAPIFRVYCVGCHHDADPEGDFSLETWARLRKGGDRGDPITPGDADASLLLQSVERRARPHMPPRREPQPPESAKATLRRWVEEGAKGPATDRSILERLVVPRIEAAPGVAAAITALSLSPDGGSLAVGRFGRVEVLDAASYAPRRVIDGLPGKVQSVGFVAEGSGLVLATGVTGLRGEARSIGLGEAAEVRLFTGHSDLLYDAAVSPEGSILATAGYDRVIRLWALASGELLREIDVHKGAVLDLEFDPTGAVLASASADETVKLWRVSDGVRLDTLNQPQGEQRAVAFTPDGAHVLSVGADRRIHVWRLVSRREPALNPVVASRFAHESGIVALHVTARGDRVITSAEDRTLKVWRFPELVELASYEEQPDTVSAIASPADGERFIVARLDGSLESYELPRVESAGERDPTVTSTPRSIPAATEPRRLEETEPNDARVEASVIALPFEVRGSIARAGDRDLFRFGAREGEMLTLEVNAARSGSRLDSKLEVLSLDGEPVERVVLQATRDSWFTFRGKDSSTSDDFRLHNWREMELDQLLYANGEVVRLWLYPRGPDSGFKVYPGRGARHTWFSTTARSHALGEPCYIVSPLPAGTEPPPNGLPVFRVFWENDDDPTRRLGSDSLLLFTAPHDGEYIVRVSDVRGFGASEGFEYTLIARERRPSFEVVVGGRSPAVSPGSGRELSFEATRLEGFDGAIRIDIEGLPAGFSATTPVVIEAGQVLALGAIYAAADASSPDEASWKAVRVRASATIEGREVVQELGDLGALRVGDAAKLLVEILPETEGASSERDELGRPVLTIRPGETIRARVRATRADFEGRIELGGDDSGRNLPHGLYVDNIGLNGLLIVEGQTEREFFITAAPKAPPGERLFHLRATADGGQCSAPVTVRVLTAP